MASGERKRSPHRSRSQQQPDPAAFFFLCCCFCGCRLSAAAARALLPRMASGERSEAPTAAGATAELNFKVLSIVNNKFVDELALIMFILENLGGTV